MNVRSVRISDGDGEELRPLTGGQLPAKRTIGYLVLLLVFLLVFAGLAEAAGAVTALAGVF